MRCLSAIRLCAAFALILTIVFITVDAFQSLLRAYSLCSSTVYDLVVCVVLFSVSALTLLHERQ